MKAPLLLSLFLCCSLVGFAQKEAPDFRHTVSGQLGYGWFGLLNNTTADINIDDNGNGGSEAYKATFKGSPAASVSYDYRFGRVFSLGAGIGFQSLNLTNLKDVTGGEDIAGKISINRVFLSARTLFHYGKNPKWDLYSGVRVGGTVWNVKSTVDQDEFSFNDGATLSSGSVVFPNLVPIPFGVKYYPNEHLMVGAELATGSPHVIALQVGIRL
ncbi:MAG: hypothetical protein AB8F78_15565 [Saprospiraceae bacterium]